MAQVMGQLLRIARCPHCNVAQPNLNRIFEPHIAINDDNEAKHVWAAYKCNSCGCLVTAVGNANDQNVSRMLHKAKAEYIYLIDYFPKSMTVNDIVPEPARRYLQQALNTLSSPDASVMVSASAVDSMLKIHGYIKGSLYERINDAMNAGLITKGMAEWAHHVRMDANDARHADLDNPHHTPASAKRVVDFVMALAELLFVLPARVQRGLDDK